MFQFVRLIFCGILFPALLGGCQSEFATQRISERNYGYVTGAFDNSWPRSVAASSADSRFVIMDHKTGRICAEGPPDVAVAAASLVKQSMKVKIGEKMDIGGDNARSDATSVIQLSDRVSIQSLLSSINMTTCMAATNYLACEFFKKREGLKDIPCNDIFKAEVEVQEKLYQAIGADIVTILKESINKSSPPNSLPAPVISFPEQTVKEPNASQARSESSQKNSQKTK